MVEWQDVCSGYTFNSRSVTEFQSYTGDTVLSDRRYSSWESSNGETFRFSVENFVNENHAEGAAGTADAARGVLRDAGPHAEARRRRRGPAAPSGAGAARSSAVATGQGSPAWTPVLLS